MGKDVPIISKALRLVSFSLTFVTIIIFATIGYSAVQVFEGVLEFQNQFKPDKEFLGIMWNLYSNLNCRIKVCILLN